MTSSLTPPPHPAPSPRHLPHTSQVFVTLAGGLRAEEDLEFASQMVQQLNLILLTTPEAIELRLLLKQSTSNAEGATLFQVLPSYHP